MAKRTRLRAASAAACLALLGTLAVPSHAAPGAPTVVSPKSGSLFAVPEVEIVGSVDGSTVEVRIMRGATVLASTGVAQGGFRVTVGNLADGTHNLLVRPRDAGGISGTDTPLTVIIDTSAPAAPVITAPASGQTLSHGNVTIEGTAEPSSSITVREISIGARFDTTTDVNGNWSVQAGLGDGIRVVNAIATDAAGNISAASPNRSFRIDTLPPAAPVVSLPAEGTFTRFPTVTMQGFAEPGATVLISEGTLLTSTIANGDSSWRATLSFAEGDHAVSVRSQDSAGHMSPATIRRFTVDLTAPAPPIITTPIQLSVVAPFQIPVTGRAEPFSELILFRGGVEVGSEDVDKDGNWLVVLMESPTGRNELVARARDRAGNLSAPSAVRAFDVDGTPPEVDISTEDGSIFLLKVPQIEGTASDDYGVLRVELAFYDLAGRGVSSSIAICGLCPVGKQVSWRSSETPLLGRFIVKAYAVDRVGNRSVEQQITVTIARTP